MWIQVRILKDNGWYATTMIWLLGHELCDGFYIEKGYTISKNRRESVEVQIILIIRCERQVIDIESWRLVLEH